MNPTRYSTYEAKARFSEILRKVRSGESVYISYRGKEVAEIRPIQEQATVEQRLERLEQRGVLTPRPPEPAQLRPLTRSPGALQRFLDSRD